jgi:resuscitation-promoting factor RpfA
MEKSPDAFRTISEVADWLGVPTHVLRFWESRFPQVKPVKRAGGRRYYRPADMMLLGGIKRLLHDDGLTIRGVQKMLREEGVRHVSSFSQPLDAGFPIRDVTPEEDADVAGPMAVDVEPEPLDNVVALAPAGEELREAPEPLPELESEPEEVEPEEASVEAPDAFVLRPEDGDRPAVPVEAPPEPAADAETPADEQGEVIPEFSFLRRARTMEALPEPAEPPQTDLFSSRRTAEPAPPAAEPAPPPPEPPRPRIPPTPDVAATDAPDDDAATPAIPGFAARVTVWDIRPDHAAIAQVVADLRAVRARL